MRAQNQRLDPDRHSSEASEFEAALRERIIGQESVIRAVVDLYQVFCTGMCPQGRPVGNLLFLGPTGPGKTRVVEAAAEILFGGPRAVQQWLVGTHHGVSRGQLQVYLDEFVFRHNCRRQPMALLGTIHRPTPYDRIRKAKDLSKSPTPPSATHSNMGFPETTG